MGKYITVSVKVPVEIKERMKKLNIKPSKLLRKTIEEEIKRREVELINEELATLRPVLDRIPLDEAVKSIREDRESR